jgi:hypothetical protein
MLETDLWLDRWKRLGADNELIQDRFPASPC